MVQQIYLHLVGGQLYSMNISEMSNKELDKLLSTTKLNHDIVKKDLISKLDELSSLEDLYKSVLVEIKNRYNIK